MCKIDHHEFHHGLRKISLGKVKGQHSMLGPRYLTSGARRLRSAFDRLRWSLNRDSFETEKRILDILAAGTLLLILAPLFMLIALAIVIESRGPVFFKQQRVGQRGQRFLMWKFRSMFVDAEARKAQLSNHQTMSGGIRFKIQEDPRITRVGRILRRASFDELPQLWNVLKGDMSLVGPRPSLPNEVALYTVHDLRRLEAKPGITCIWQVSGRSDIPFDQQVEMDIAYVHGQSLSKDVELLYKTIPAVLSGRGAY